MFCDTGPPHSFMGTIILSHEATIFWLKNDDEKWSRVFHFEILHAPSEIPANLLSQFSHSGQIFLYWAATL